MIEAITGRGAPRAKAICDDCGREEVVTCDYTHGPGREWRVNEGQMKRKLAAHGWTEVKGKLRCPSCEAKRKAKVGQKEKVVKMQDAKEKPAATVPPNRQPTRAEKRQIMDLLDDVYDVERECYKGGDTDETVAEVLGVMPGWVSEIREEFFGSDGGNADIDALIARLDDLTKQAARLSGDVARVAGDYDALKGALKDAGDEIARIKRAVGPRAMQRAKGGR